MIKAVVFDLDDTLYPEHRYVDSGFKAVDQFLTENYNLIGFYEVASLLFSKGSRGYVFNEALESLSFSHDDAFIKLLVSVYRNHNPDIKLDETTQRVLDYISRFYKTALITDGYQVAQKKKIESLNIGTYFDHICITDVLGKEYWKPHEISYKKTEEFLNVAPEECVYVGDNPTKDFVTPNRLGWKTIQILTEKGEYCSMDVDQAFQAHIKIDSFFFLKNVLGYL
ncbi:HAD family hydrolase [Endozoicomonas sp. 8E]|uniref:HAD family hydrolase n=1 Tax=Endozoicomonas sp. 8E TaxID=3035692 RepID=UPI00293912B0|nr:HAD family hydrolase [Endozoicomonas sp. 8E]WOG25808.1 HAD hydrolase-like protein [Endozoicomonas sp. 8E]